MKHAQRSVLVSLFTLARSDVHATVIRLVHDTELTRPEVVSALAELDEAGLVDRSAVRLTLSGLMVAVSLGNPKKLRLPRRDAEAA